MCPQNQKILLTNHHYGNPSTRFSVEPFNLAGIAIKNGRDLPVTRTVQMAFLDLTNRRQNLRILDFLLGLDLPFLEPNVI